MKPARDAILWAARNRWLADHLPRYRFVRASVRRFMPGEGIEDALDAAERLAADGIPATLTYLGEHVEKPADADGVAEHYQGLLDRVEERRLDAEISVKPTHLGLGLGPDDTFERLRGLAERSAASGRHLFVDMEDSSYVDPTLALYRRLLEATPNVGVCLQAYLHRTPSDVADLAARGGSIRLVKGAYREPRDVAIQDRWGISNAFGELSLGFLRRAG
ncbi:MAG TPA: proline dehydrogenase family protein, partial [Actinomycetota bacterium]|nr:proline dehydrogenase family protein [Actinomycetota bacterium]